MTPKQKARAKAKSKKLKDAKAAAKAAAAVAAAGAEPGAAEGNLEEGAAPAEGATEEAGGGVLAVPTKQPRGGGAMRKKLLAALELGDKTIEQLVDEKKAELQTAEAMIEESEALEQAQAKQAGEAAKEFEDAKAAVTAAITAERTGAAKKKAMQDKRGDARGAVDEKRKVHTTAQQKLATAEVISINRQREEELEKTKQAAKDAAEAAKKRIMENRQKEKEELERTRQALKLAREGKKPRTAAPEAEQAPAADSADIE